MRSESRWREHLRGQYPQYLTGERDTYGDTYDEDDTVGMSYHESNVKKILVASAIAAGGYAAYRSGLLKSGIKALFEYADNYKAYAPTAVKTFKSWTAKNMDIPTESLVRQKHLIRKLFKGEYSAKTVTDTIDDFKQLRESVRKNVAEATAKATRPDAKRFGDTRLMFQIGRMNDALDQLPGTAKAGYGAVRQKISQNVVKKMTLDPKKAAQQMRRTGYKSATLGDLIDVQLINGQYKIINKFDNINLNDGDKTLGKLEEFLRNVAYDSNGKALKDKTGKFQNLITSGQYKNLVLDGNIMIDEAGKVIDLRTANNSIKDFVNSLANDFQIPILGINPLRFMDINKYTDDAIDYALLHADTIQPYITNKLGRHKLKETFGNNPLVFVDGDVFKFSDDFKNLEKVAGNMHIYEIPEKLKTSYGLPREVDELRKIAGLNLKEVTKFDESDEWYKRFYGKISEYLDLGFQDKRIKELIDKDESVFKYFDPNTYIEAANKKFGQIHQPYKDAKYYNLGDVFGSTPEKNQKVYVAFNNSKKLKDVFDKESSTTIGDYFYQFVAGRGKDGEGLKNVTSATTVPYYLLERVNQSLGGIGLALSNDSLGSAGSIIKNMILKRFLPIYAGYQAYEYLNYITEEDEDGDGDPNNGNPDNITKKLARGVVKLDLGWHQVKDALGITDWAKEVAPLMPGGEQISDIPGLGILDLSETVEEREEYYESGMDPVRKGRFWDLGNTPFTGGKVMYFQPNWYRRTMADVKFSDSLYGSRDEYFANAPFPTLHHPFAPLRHFIFDKYHYEMKHYYDRPYLMSSPEFENTPIIGPILGNTVGQIIKPSIKMHDEYWVQNGGERQPAPEGSGVSFSLPGEGEVLKVANQGGNGTGGTGIVIPPTEPSEPKNEAFEIYQTASGGMQVVNIDDSKSMWSVNKELDKYSIKKVEGAETRVSFEPEGEEVPVDIVDPTDLSYIAGQQFNNLADVTGIIGFGVQGFITGEANAGETVIETSGYAYSMNRQFWDANVGGLGGEMSEIFRRFVQNRSNSVNYYNPVKNAMPEWMPGETYFTDFQHGDPYSKIPKGEMRLPGEGYERLWDIKDPLEFNIGSSSIGKSKTDIIKHYLHQDEITDEEGQDIVDFGTDMHRKIERMWLEAGIAVDTEGTIEDKENHIIGYYDARINDPSSDSGYAIVDIKTIGSKGFEKVKKEHKAKELHQKQVNFYLRATGDEKGYIHYVNRDNPEEQLTIGFKYDEDMWEETLSTLESAREYIRQGIADGTIQRGDMYDYIDRFRILADTAPYSKEFQEVSAVISKLELTPEQREEVSAIRQRLSEQKEPMRIYPYKFKTADVVYKDVKVKKVLNADTFIVEGYENNPIKLAGVHVKSDKSNKDFEEAQKKIRGYIYEGAKLRIAIDADPLHQVSDDQLRTMRATVYSNGVNVNLRMLNEGLATEKEDDWSAPAVHARFSPGQIAFGKVWETIAHLDTPINTKLMQVRSAKESYERREVYGKDFQDWRHPINDFIIPLVDSNLHRPAGLLFGTFIGALFGKTTYGRLIGAAVGFTSTAIGKTYIAAKEQATGEQWIPERRQKDRELNEYVDMLKFVKYKRLFEEYSEQALDKYGVDVKEMISKEKQEGDMRKQRVRDLEEIKRRIKLDPENVKAAHALIKDSEINLKYYDSSAKTTKEIISAINKEINEQTQYRQAYRERPEVTKAIQYYNLSEQTMYGYDPGEPLQNILKALPKKERDYMKYFMKAPEEERQDILDMVPRYLRRPLQSAWGMEVDEKEDLVEYFTEHQLPGPSWVGWQEDVNMDAVKVKLIKHEAREFKEFNVWEDDVNMANAAGEIPLPRINFRSSAEAVRSKLQDVLHGLGVQDVRIDVVNTASNADVQVNIREDKRREIEERLRNMPLI